MQAEALVVGGGPSGAALALLLARAGRGVVLLEREAGPHDKVCGEFISVEAAAYLQHLGLDLVALGAVEIRQMALAARGVEARAALPFTAYSLSRRRLDEALLGLAAGAGVDVRRGERVRQLLQQDSGWLAEVDAGAVRAPAAFLATGKHDLRGRRRPSGLHGSLVGFKLHMRLEPQQATALKETVELHLFPGGYAGLEPIEEGLANLCLVAEREMLPEGAFLRLLEDIRAACPLLDQRLTGAEALWPKPLAVAAIPYGHVARSTDGLWRLGDQAAVIPSFAGDGLGIALHSAHAAATAYLAGKTAPAFQKRLGSELGARVRATAMLSRLLVQGWAQPIAVGLTRLRPQLLPAAAACTRIPESALRRLRPGSARPGTAGNIPPSGRRSDCPA